MSVPPPTRAGPSPLLVTLLYLPLPMVVVGFFTAVPLLLSEHQTVLLIALLCTVIGMIGGVPLALTAAYLAWTRRRGAYWGAVATNALVTAMDVTALVIWYLDAQ